MEKEEKQHDVVLEHTELSCTICLNTFHTPVTTKCGHTFCFACVCDCIQGAALHCPLCRLEMTSLDIFEIEENKFVKSIIEKCGSHRKLNAREKSKVQYWKSEKLNYLQKKKKELELKTRTSTRETICHIVYNKLEPYVFCIGFLLLLVVLLELLAQVYLVTTRIPIMTGYDLENSRMESTLGGSLANNVQPLVFAQSTTWSKPKDFENYQSFCGGIVFCPKQCVLDNCETAIVHATCRPMTDGEKNLEATSNINPKDSPKEDIMATRHIDLGSQHDFNSGETIRGKSSQDELADFFIDAAAAVARKTFLPPNYMMVMLSLMDEIFLNNTFSGLALEAVLVDPVPNLVNATKMLLGL